MDTLDQTINEALWHFGLGRPLERQATCVIAAVIGRLTEQTMICDVLCPRTGGEPFRRCEFLRTAVRADFYGPAAALIEIPKTYLPVFVLWDYVMPEKLLERFRSRAEQFNAPYLKTDRVGSVEKIGGIRI